MPSSLGVQFLYSVDKQQEFRTLSIGIIAFVFFFPPVYMRGPKNRDRLFEKKLSLCLLIG